MCGTCGCGDEGGGTRISLPHEEHTRATGRPHHSHDQSHSHSHSHDQGRHDHEGAHDTGETVTLEQRVLAKNELQAEQNRAWLAERHIVAVNLMSSPGAGKTTLLERTIRDFSGRRPVAVVEGDQETMLDAERIKRAGCAVVQVNTGAGCHLDAEMMQGALTALAPERGALVLVENVGNLVCPALFDLGESSRIVIISVTEGTDKPLKYPYMFGAADLVLINKADLLPYVDFDVARCEAYARSVNPDVRVLTVSATTGEGMDQWYAWVAALDDRMLLS
ncbi:hydrogenase nickel incorporation protein HypB [Streptomyces sp. NBC_01020]|uniref:hydrogenase nickel incorporation protein HypB n=1 Tax=unclassified Streptomyces TaxID=2593676 RepID=UPI00324CD92E|nr:hydrogenase nickel incorporation protein HypB [Streptomyces sp. NBC_01020]WSX45360.1 hydrogenase nickel incorporation protein HypB [Streptomyces sp. NBC_00963]WSX66619.1 hydrogenase nickel incorporation protein HypB [Streptomyces sp. NBC_00932]